MLSDGNSHHMIDIKSLCMSAFKCVHVYLFYMIIMVVISKQTIARIFRPWAYYTAYYYRDAIASSSNNRLKIELN